MLKVIFAGVHNAGRSQMAAAFFNRFADASKAREEMRRAITMTKNLREQELMADKLKQIEKATLSA